MYYSRWATRKINEINGFDLENSFWENKPLAKWQNQRAEIQT